MKCELCGFMPGTVAHEERSAPLEARIRALEAELAKYRGHQLRDGRCETWSNHDYDIRHHHGLHVRAEKAEAELAARKETFGEFRNETFAEFYARHHHGPHERFPGCSFCDEEAAARKEAKA